MGVFDEFYIIYLNTRSYQVQNVVKLQTVSMRVTLIDWLIVESRESGRDIMKKEMEDEVKRNLDEQMCRVSNECSKITGNIPNVTVTGNYQ